MWFCVLCADQESAGTGSGTTLNGCVAFAEDVDTKVTIILSLPSTRATRRFQQINFYDHFVILNHHRNDERRKG